MTSSDRAEEIVAALTGAGVRATVDPSTVHPPCVLVPPPHRTFDSGCGFTARWELAALAPSPTGGNRSTWAALDQLASAAAEVLPVETAQLVSYNVAGTDYATYLLAWSETLD